MSEYVLVAEIRFEAADEDAAVLLAAELVAMPLAHDAVFATEGDVYLDDFSSEPLNRTTHKQAAPVEREAAQSREGTGG